jgi:hypothetical protein
MRVFVYTLISIATMAVTLTGCSVFQSPTPKTNVAIERHTPVVTTDGNGKEKQEMQLADSIEMPESWATGSVELDVEETYTLTPDGAEALTGRVLKVRRNSDAGPAGQVAADRAAAATVSVEALGALINALGGQIATTQVRRYETQVDRAQIESDTERALLKAKVEELEARIAESEAPAEEEAEVAE